MIPLPPQTTAKSYTLASMPIIFFPITRKNRIYYNASFHRKSRYISRARRTSFLVKPYNKSTKEIEILGFLSINRSSPRPREASFIGTTERSALWFQSPWQPSYYHLPLQRRPGCQGGIILAPKKTLCGMRRAFAKVVQHDHVCPQRHGTLPEQTWPFVIIGSKIWYLCLPKQLQSCILWPLCQ